MEKVDVKNIALNISVIHSIAFFNRVCVCGFFSADFTFEYIQREGLRDPIIFMKADGLGIQYVSLPLSPSSLCVFFFFLSLSAVLLLFFLRRIVLSTLRSQNARSRLQRERCETVCR